MMKAGRGHIVNIASAAGHAGGAGTSIYSAKKSGVTVHVVSPGFIDGTGMAADMQNKDEVDLEGIKAIYGRSQGYESADAVVYAIKHDYPDLIVNNPNTRFLFALSTLFPRLPDALATFPGMEV